MAVFAFMCHHSLPSIILPLADKRKTLQVVLVDYVIVLLYCSTIVFSAVLNKPASAISQLYTLNFSDHSVAVLAKFLTLYPVFTLSSNFPLICITLRNNLLALFPISKVNWVSIFLLCTVLGIFHHVYILIFNKNIYYHFKQGNENKATDTTSSKILGGKTL